MLTERISQHRGRKLILEEPAGDTRCQATFRAPAASSGSLAVTIGGGWDLRSSTAGLRSALTLGRRACHDPATFAAGPTFFFHLVRHPAAAPG